MDAVHHRDLHAPSLPRRRPSNRLHEAIVATITTQRRKKPAAAHLGTLRMGTGEAYYVEQVRLPGRSYGVSFHTTFDEATAKIARGISSGATLRVFLILPQHLDYQQFRKLDQVKLGGQLGLDQASVSRAMAQLLAIGVVEKQGRGPLIAWRLSAEFGWRGSVDSFHAFKRSTQAGTHPEQQRPSVAEDIERQPVQRNLRLLAHVGNTTVQAKSK